MRLLPSNHSLSSKEFAVFIAVIVVVGVIAWASASDPAVLPRNADRPARAVGVCPPFPLRDEAGKVIDPVRGINDAVPYSPKQTCGAAGCPLGAAPALPDVVVVEGPPEPPMWLALADLNVASGRRRRGDTAVLQATCVDATGIPHIEQRLNFSLGCYGCREATDMGVNETILGFPGAALNDLVAALEQLYLKSVGRSRAKAALNHLRGKKEPT